MTTTPSDTPRPVLEAIGVSKQYAGVQALRGVSLKVMPGEVLAVVGENGAGKSTLMKILAGVVQPSAGTLKIDGTEVAFSGVQQALAAGISLIHQELNLAPNLDVGSNIFLGREPRWMGLIDRHTIARESARYMQRVGLDISPYDRLDTIPIGKQQLVEIAKALSTNARVLIMDEPTSSLTQQEANRLYEVVRQLRSEGVAIVYISHRLNEVTELADRVVVLRDGSYVGELVGSQIERSKIVQMMVGRDIDQFYIRTPHECGDEVLKVEGLRTPANPAHPLDFTIRRGEIVGLAGLVGAGRTELLTTLFGVTPAVGGTMQVCGRPFAPRTASQAIGAGVVLAPEDRRLAGLLLGHGVRPNLTLASLRQRIHRYGFIRHSAERQLYDSSIKKLQIKTANHSIPVRNLSGGNQQKVVLAKWLAMEPKLLLLDEPTRGIDVGTKAEIYSLIHDLAGQGMAILFVSSDMEEIIGLADRAMVMHEGRISGELPREQLAEEAIMRLAVGDANTPAPSAV